MTVYVDDMRRPARVGRINARWSHLIADTPDELRAFARRLGLRPEWIQHEGTYREHFDVVDAVRTQAIELGAEPISYLRDTGRLMARKRAAVAPVRSACSTCRRVDGHEPGCLASAQTVDLFGALSDAIGKAREDRRGGAS